jgi:hypothetical protein
LDEVFKKAGLVLRKLGFRGSGQTYRKVEDDFVFVVNFQRSRALGAFYVNLGAQPTFIPAECDASLKTLKEYECVWRERVGDEWPLDLSEERFQSFADELVAAQHAFFGHAKTLPVALTRDSPEALLDNFACASMTQARLSLHLARAALALKRPDIARELATRGLQMSSSHATVLMTELCDVLDASAARR